MAVRKFRSVEELQRSHWHSPGAPELAEVIAAVWGLAESTAPQRFPPGVHRHRSIVEAEALREEWSRANFRRFWAERGGMPFGVAAEIREPEG